MAERLVVDPVTRIEGHLRIEAKVKDGKVEEAYSSGTMVRGLELILPGRDPRDAWALAQRICGVCTTVHAITSVRAVEDALNIRIPNNANVIRNIMAATLYVHDHTVHFYHLHALDWVDVLSALKADPQKTAELAQSVSPWPNGSVGYYKDLLARLNRFASTGQLGPFAGGYWGHTAYKLPPEANLMAVGHYLDMLDWQKEIVKIHAIFGGKNPHPNYLVGGWASVLDANNMASINAEKLAYIATLIAQAKQVVEQCYIPDVFAIAGFYKDVAAYGGGVQNYLAWGEFPTADIRDPEHFLLPRGAILNRNLKEVVDVDPRDPEQLQEFITHSWYEYAGGDKVGLHPWSGETKLKYTGPKPPFEQLDVSGKYSWIKSPRWKGKAMEVGPLARVLVAYAKGRNDVVELVNDSLKRLGVGPEALFSTLGRTLARALETKLAVGWLQQMYDQLVANMKSGDLTTVDNSRWEPSTWPSDCKGVGISEAPRGGLAHYIHIKDARIANYQCVVPTTWNGSPRDANGEKGPYEASLEGVPVANEAQPLEIIRTIHSFDPCLACSVHAVNVDHPEKVHIAHTGGGCPS